MTNQTKLRSFTEGGVFFKVLLFVLPIMATNLLQVFYNAADMIVVSFSHEENAVGAIGTTGAFINLVVNIFIGISVGANVVVARAIGAQNKDAIQKSVHTALAMALGCGFLGMIVGLLAARPVLSMMGTTGSLLSLAIRYTYIYFLGIPFMALTNFLAAIFRAKGDSKTPLLTLTGAGLLNVALNFFFVLVVGLSVEGVAIATVASNIVSAVVMLVKLQRVQDETRFSWKALALDKRALREIAVNGLPAGIQGALFSLSNMLIQSSIVQVNNILSPGTSYAPIVDGNAAAANLEGFVYCIMNAVYQGTITFASQNMGAQKPRRIYKILYSCFGLVTFFSVAVACLVYLFRVPLLGLYGIAPGEAGTIDAMAFATAQTRFGYICLPYFILGVSDVCTGVLRGMGRSVLSMFISLVCVCLFRVVWLLTVFPANTTLDIIYLSYSISWILNLIASFIFVQVLLGKTIKRLDLQVHKQEAAHGKTHSI